MSGGARSPANPGSALGWSAPPVGLDSPDTPRAPLLRAGSLTTGGVAPALCRAPMRPERCTFLPITGLAGTTTEAPEQSVTRPIGVRVTPAAGTKSPSSRHAAHTPNRTRPSPHGFVPRPLIGAAGAEPEAEWLSFEAFTVSAKRGRTSVDASSPAVASMSQQQQQEELPQQQEPPPTRTTSDSDDLLVAATPSTASILFGNAASASAAVRVAPVAMRPKRRHDDLLGA